MGTNSENRIVYRDKSYPTSWVDLTVADQITSYLVSKGFSIMNAKTLRKWMENAILQGPFRTVVVFSQDKMPDTVFDDISAVATIRRYLDLGGRCVWFGDVPFYYRGKTNEETEDTWKNGTHVTLLGVNPVFAPAPTEPARITRAGRSLGLRTSWSGIRPVLMDKRMLTLARSRQLVGRPSLIIRKRLFQVKNIEISATPKVEIASGEKLEGETFQKIYVNAWFKIFSHQYLQSGFMRIWDYPLRRSLSAQELSELLAVTISNIWWPYRSWPYRHPYYFVA